MIGRASTRIWGAPRTSSTDYLGERPVYVIRLDDWRELEEEFVIEPVPMPMPDSLSRVVGRREDAT